MNHITFNFFPGTPSFNHSIPLTSPEGLQALENNTYPMKARNFNPQSLISLCDQMFTYGYQQGFENIDNFMSKDPYQYELYKILKTTAKIAQFIEQCFQKQAQNYHQFTEHHFSTVLLSPESDVAPFLLESFAKGKMATEESGNFLYGGVQSLSKTDKEGANNAMQAFRSGYEQGFKEEYTNSLTCLVDKIKDCYTRFVGTSQFQTEYEQHIACNALSLNAFRQPWLEAYINDDIQQPTIIIGTAYQSGRQYGKQLENCVKSSVIRTFFANEIAGSSTK